MQTDQENVPRLVASFDLVANGFEELVGQTCGIIVLAANGDSVHLYNFGRLVTGDNETDVLETESEPNVLRTVLDDRHPRPRRDDGALQHHGPRRRGDRGHLRGIHGVGVLRRAGHHDHDTGDHDHNTGDHDYNTGDHDYNTGDHDYNIGDHHHDHRARRTTTTIPITTTSISATTVRRPCPLPGLALVVVG